MFGCGLGGLLLWIRQPVSYMAPPFTGAYIMHTTGINMELTANIGVGFSLLPMKSAHLDNVGIRESVVGGSLSSQSRLEIEPSPGDTIIHVILFTSPIQVFWPNANRVITSMKCALSKFILANKQSKGNSAGLKRFAVIKNNAVALVVNFASPKPAPFVIWNNEHAIHEPVFN